MLQSPSSTLSDASRFGSTEKTLFLPTPLSAICLWLSVPFCVVCRESSCPISSCRFETTSLGNAAFPNRQYTPSEVFRKSMPLASPHPERSAVRVPLNDPPLSRSKPSSLGLFRGLFGGVAKGHILKTPLNSSEVLRFPGFRVGGGR